MTKKEFIDRIEQIDPDDSEALDQLAELFEEDYLTTCQFSTVSKPIYAHFRYDGFNGE